MGKKIPKSSNSKYGSKLPQHSKRDGNKKISSVVSPDYYMKQHPSWRFARADKEKWLFFESFADNILPFLESIEKMTWQEILSASKSHGQGSKSHEIEVSSLTKSAQKRLEELKIYEDTLTSIRINAKVRLWGIREESVFYILWYDKEHEICNSMKKNT